MTSTSSPIGRQLPGGSTLGELSAFLSDARHFPHLARRTVGAYRIGCRKILNLGTADPATVLDSLDIDALAAAFAAAHPQLKPASVTTYAKSARHAIDALRMHTALTPAPRPARSPTGTVGHLPAFLGNARKRGPMPTPTAAATATAIRRILRDLPDLAARPAAGLNQTQVLQQFAAANPQMTAATLDHHRTALHAAITAYTTQAGAPTRPSPVHPLGPPAHQEEIPTAPGAETVLIPETVRIPLPGGRQVSVSTPPDMTEPEARAAAALLRLYHPALVPGPAAESAQTGWTLVFWTEDALEQPEVAHLSGPEFSIALAAYIRARCPDFADRTDTGAIDAWYSTEIFVALAFDGHHDARDSATRL
jgi:hypothetical protein